MKEKLYFNGTILTMEESTVEAVLVSGDTIKKIGTLEEVKAYASSTVEMIDLKGHTMMPSFIDSHSHFMGYAYSFVEVSLEHATSFDDILETIKTYVKENQVKPGEWVVASNYDHNNLKERKHPTRLLLDEACPNNPLVIKHQSGHVGVFNTLGLESIGEAQERGADKMATGYLEETAFIDAIKKIPLISMERLLEVMKKAQDKYLSFGITTVQEGYMVKELIPMFQLLLHTKMLKFDLVGYMDFPAEEAYKAMFPNHIKRYEDHFKIGGLKTFMDGSPQACTAWMLSPYKNMEDGYKGAPTQTKEELVNKFTHAMEEDMQLLCHCNGDAAIECFIDSYEMVKQEFDKKGCNLDIRPVIIHAQLMTKEQIKKAKSLDMIASFFVGHVYYWGDIHIGNFGEDRAKEISPAGTAEKEHLTFTFHQDSPVIAPNMLETIWCAVNRKTLSGVTLGESEKITPYEALQAVTIHAAYQYHEEEQKGSITENKLADFVILDQNPLTVDPMKIKDIAVLETIKSGNTIYSKYGII